MKKPKGKGSPQEQGDAAFKSGVSLAFCPYEIGDKDRALWQDGWQDAAAKKEKDER